MDTDLMLVLGLIVAAFALVSLVSAFSESRFPRAALVAGVVGGGMIAYAMTQRPGGYDFGDIPATFATVIDRYLL